MQRRNRVPLGQMVGGVAAHRFERWFPPTRRVAVSLLAVFALGCVRNEPGSGELGDPCTSGAGCESSICHDGRCSESCFGNCSCPEGYRCSSSTGIGACEPGVSSCMRDAGPQCVMQGYECNDTSECCLTGYLGSSRSCVESELTAGVYYCTGGCTTDADCSEGLCRCVPRDPSLRVRGELRETGECTIAWDCLDSSDCCPNDVCLEHSYGRACRSTCVADGDCSIPGDCCNRVLTVAGSTQTARVCSPCIVSGGGTSCDDCLSSCRGLSGCCRGDGCLCDSECN